MERILRFLEKYIIPKSVYKLSQPIYHFLMAFYAALIYGFPSRKMTIIGVTGTKGKTTVCNLIAHIFNSAGIKTGMTTTVNFLIGDTEWQNKTKQTMLGRFQLQKMLAQMVKAGCEYAVVETSSEGILQYRHSFIDYDIAVFTNLTPEHIERHGGFENYRDAKIKLFEKVAKKRNGIGIYNLDDENVKYFLKPDVKIKYGYGIKFPISNFQFSNKFKVSNIELHQNKTEFSVDGVRFTTPLIGEFNVYNAVSAICAALSQNIALENIQKALVQAKAPPGRLEIIDEGQNFTAIVDYAHEPASLEAVYKTILDSRLKDGSSRLICLLGAQGGGRDRWKRQAMGKIAARYCDTVILTNEDPYDENPSDILNQIEEGVCANPANNQCDDDAVYKIIDREEAIKKTLSLAEAGDVVILTGKGGESWMCIENNKKIPWDESGIVKKLLG